jgi:hypothetical protein
MLPAQLFDRSIPVSSPDPTRQPSGAGAARADDCLIGYGPWPALLPARHPSAGYGEPARARSAARLAFAGSSNSTFDRWGSTRSTNGSDRS